MARLYVGAVPAEPGPLAYVFWHRPVEGTDAGGYEAALRAFHAELAHAAPAGFSGSCSFARAPLPWFDGYEDWYLVADWAALGTLNAAAVAARSLPAHDAVATRAAAGTGAVFALQAGAPDLGAVSGATWSDAPVDGDARWRRQLVLGPAPQYCAHHRSGGAVARRVL